MAGDEKVIKFPNKINGSVYFKQFELDLLKVLFVVGVISFVVFGLVINLEPMRAFLMTALCEYIAGRFYMVGKEGGYRRSFLKHKMLQRGLPFIQASYKKFFLTQADKNVPDGFFIRSFETIFVD